MDEVCTQYHFLLPLVVKDIFINTKTYTFVGLDNVAKILAAIIVMAIAYKTRSMGLSVVFGLIAVAFTSDGSSSLREFLGNEVKVICAFSLFLF